MENAASQESIFQVFVPVYAHAVTSAPAKTTPTPEFKMSGTVLLIEDEHFLRKVTVHVLVRMGFKVLEAHDGIEALKVFRHHKEEVHCVICDMSMPRMNGWETIQALRTLRPNLPVVIVSGYDKASIMDGNHTEQPHIFLSKPYTRKELGAALSWALDGLEPAHAKNER